MLEPANNLASARARWFSSTRKRGSPTISVGKNGPGYATSPLARAHPRVAHVPWHQWIKYLVYGALALNIFFFFRDEWLASAHTFESGIPLAEIISAFAASIDTATWVLLLLLFEVETYQLPRERITPRLAATFRIIRGGCYAFICYAFYGYLSKAIGLLDFVPFGGDPCALASEGYSLMIELDKYLPFRGRHVRRCFIGC